MSVLTEWKTKHHQGRKTLQGKSDAGSFYYHKSLCHFEFVLNGQTMNQTFTLKSLGAYKMSSGGMPWKMGRYDWILSHDNVPTHQPLLVSNYS